MKTAEPIIRVTLPPLDLSSPGEPPRNHGEKIRDGRDAYSAHHGAIETRCILPNTATQDKSYKDLSSRYTSLPSLDLIFGPKTAETTPSPNPHPTQCNQKEADPDSETWAGQIPSSVDLEAERRVVELLDRPPVEAAASSVPGECFKAENGSSCAVLAEKPLALDLETFGEPEVSGGKQPKIKPSKDALSPRKGEIRLVTLAGAGGNIMQFDLLSQPLPAEIREAVSRHPLVIHGAGFDLGFLFAKLGLVPDHTFCTLTASRLLANGTNADSDLGAVLRRYLAIDLPKDQGGSDWGVMLLTDAQLEYARNDVLYLHPLKATLEGELEQAGLTRIFELESTLIPVVVQMEANGVAVDSLGLHLALEQAGKRASAITSLLRTGFGIRDLNVDSPDQLKAAFAKTGVNLSNTAESTLAEADHPLAKLVLDYRAQGKLGTTVQGLIKSIGDDGRIRTRFNPLGAASGRFSSSGPNLQNIPRGPLRECFVAPGPEHRLVIADFSQMELRAAAILAKDAEMIKAFRAGKDLHVETAAAVLGKAVSDVTKADRQLAKAVNFGFLYGQRPRGFCGYAKTDYGLEIALDQATAIRDRFFEQYAGLASWHHAARQGAPTLIEGRTILGRRLLPNPNEKEENRRWNRFQMATNYTVQGSCADALKLAMTRLMSVLPSSARLVLTVHDELVLECAAEDASIVAGQTAQVMKEAFREVFGDAVPAEVETHVCANWGEKA
jgi:DNA polymerase I